MELARHAHACALKEVKRCLEKMGLPYKAVYRSGGHNSAGYTLLISVGGDGTFLEAARGMLDTQAILGVNSDPKRSAGSFCAADARTFKNILRRILEGKACVRNLNRLQLRLNGKSLPFHAVNDLLITHEKPAAMSRYSIQIHSRQEEQRSSGLWISTAAGSTGAIRSAGGRVMDRGSLAIQYRPRELYPAPGLTYRLKGGVVQLKHPLRIGSLMRRGLICVDGEHVRIPFRYGDLLEVVRAKTRLRLIWR